MANMPLHPDVATIDCTVSDFQGRTSVRLGSHFIGSGGDTLPGQRCWALHVDTTEERTEAIAVINDLLAKFRAALEATPVRAPAAPASSRTVYAAQRNGPVTRIAPATPRSGGRPDASLVAALDGIPA